MNKVLEFKNKEREICNQKNAEAIREIADAVGRGEYNNYAFYGLLPDGKYCLHYGAYLSKHECAGILFEIASEILAKGK